MYFYRLSIDAQQHQLSRGYQTFLSSLFAMLLFAMPAFAQATIFPPSPTGSRIAVVNRGEQTVSLIDVESEMVVDMVLPADSEPMYAQNPLYSNEIWIGDRGRNSVMVFDALRLRLKTEISVGKGVFHMWSHPALGQMWVVNDIDKTVSVISLERKEVVATIAIPKDLADEFKPHDVSTTATDGIVSLLGGETGWLIKFSGETFEEVGRLQVPADPHLMHWGLEGSQLYVAAQGGKVLQISPATLKVIAELDIPNAHGLWANEAQTRLYVGDIGSTDGGSAIYTIDIANFQILGDTPADALAPNPHNFMVSIDGSKLFVTHSGANQVSIFDLDSDGMPIATRTIHTGDVPFGIMLVRDPQEPSSDTFSTKN